MPDTTLRSNARTMPIDRRAALSAILGAGSLAVIPSAVEVVNGDTLATLIADHREARAAFETAIDELEAAEPNKTRRVLGMADCDYSVENGQDRITDWIDNHFERLSESAAAIEKISPAIGKDALAVLKRERDAALDRVTEAFAGVNAAQMRWQESCNAEEAALEAVCSHRCCSPDEYAVKFQHLLKYREEFNEKHSDAMFASLLPKGMA